MFLAHEIFSFNSLSRKHNKSEKYIYINKTQPHFTAHNFIQTMFYKNNDFRKHIPGNVMTFRPYL